MIPEELGALLRLVIALPLVLLLVYYGLRFLLARGLVVGSAEGSAMRILDRLPLGPKSMLCVIQVDRHFFLLAVSETRVELVKELQYYPERPAAEGPSRLLREMAGKMGKTFGGGGEH